MNDHAAMIDRTVWRVVGDPLVEGSESGPLAGTRVAVKDLFAVAGQVVGAGNPAWERSASVAARNAPAVQALLDAGGNVVGIARTDEFAYSLAGQNAHTGTPPNPAAPDRLPGGSTSGPAAAVATGSADLALGTDTAGSVRVPASYQGLWGLRTTHGSVSPEGLLPLAQTFDTIGWLARSPSLLSAAARASLPATGESLDGSVLLLDEQLLETTESSTRAAFTAWLADKPVRQVRLPDLGQLAETVRVVQAAEAWRNNGDWVRSHRGAIGADVLARFDAAATITPAAESAARADLDRLRRQVREVIGRGALCLPTVPGPAPYRQASGEQVRRARTATLRMTAIAGIGGLPAVSCPALTVDAAPVGVCLVGPAGADLTLLDLAAALVPAAAPPGTTPDPHPKGH
jgi:Asp-tRNA(Asn)/Glu-tRNA(Gln) amidotransferase A subunit family amidase